ncbi:MAG: tetratricopeptide repeat protein [Polyangiaceae bacterium]|nr:tetratricopeptide repeat protein [Polyangiaceae bacterium]
MNEHRPFTVSRAQIIAVFLCGLVLVTAIVAVYAPVRNGVFIWDDHALIEHNDALRTSAPFGLLRQPFWQPDSMSDTHPAYYRPVAAFSFHFDVVMSDADPHTLHRSNIAFHSVAALLLAIAAWRLGSKPSSAFAVSLLWALSPRLTESVGWISGRTDVLATMFTLAAFALWPWWTKSGIHSVRTPWVRASASSILFLLALLSKEVAFAGLVAIAVGTWTDWRAAARRLSVFAPALATYFVLRQLALARVTSVLPAAVRGPVDRTALVFETLGRYTEMTLDPWHPASSIGVAGIPNRGYVVFGAAVALAVAFAAARSWRRNIELRYDDSKNVYVGLVLAGFSLLPVLQIVPLGMNGAVAADRLLTMPLAGLAISVAVVVGRLGRRGKFVSIVAAAALALTFARVTYARSAIYTNELVFWLDAAERAADGATGPRTALANVLRARGEIPVACKLHESVKDVLERTRRTETARYGRALENVASCIAILGRYEEARSIYLALLAQRPPTARVMMALGFANLHLLDFDAAAEALKRALDADPQVPHARALLAELPLLEREGQRFSTEAARRADPVQYARFVAAVGRAPEAQTAWLAVARDPSTSRPARMEASRFLVVDGDMESARAAVEACRSRGILDEAVWAHLVAREKQMVQVDAVHVRLDRLAQTR